MNLAPGVLFVEEDHTYWYKGKKLSGITGVVSKKLGLKYNNTFIGEHTEEGIHVHKAIQRWLNTGDPESVHPGVQWLIRSFGEKDAYFGKAYSEVLVSDFIQFASSVDIVYEKPDDTFVIYDIKKGIFKREYVTWQLSVYKYLIEKYSGKVVGECICICFKDREYYKIFPKADKEVEKLLYGAIAA